MSQTADIQTITLEEILKILQKQAQSIPLSATSQRYQKALDSLQASAHGKQAFQPTSPSPISSNREAGLSQGEESLSSGDSPFRGLWGQLTDWLVNLWLTATPFATASQYLDIISALYTSAVKADLLPKTNLFSTLKAELKDLGPEGWKKGIDDEIFSRALRLTRNADHLIADDHTAAQLVIWSLTHDLTPLDQVAMLKKPMEQTASKPSGSKGEAGLSQGEASLSPGEASLSKGDSPFRGQGGSRPRYLFPLRNRSERNISKIVNALFRRARLPQATDPNQTVEALWAYAALRAGIPASTLLRHLGHAPLGLPVLKLSESALAHGEQAFQPATFMDQTASQPSDRAAGLSQGEASLSSGDSPFRGQGGLQIGKIFLENPPQWYAMSLRPGVRFTQVCRRIQLLTESKNSPFRGLGGSQGLDIQLFYPSEEITRAIGKKIVTRQRPFIHSVVFFRAKLTDIGRLFARIGDLAWCYRQTAQPGAPYAHITDAQFRLFQQTISRFTPDYEVAPIGELELKEGDRVEILGGPFTGQNATVVEGSRVKGQESGNELPLLGGQGHTIYRLSILGENGIEWRINLDSRLLKPQ